MVNDIKRFLFYSENSYTWIIFVVDIAQLTISSDTHKHSEVDEVAKCLNLRRCYQLLVELSVLLPWSNHRPIQKISPFSFLFTTIQLKLVCQLGNCVGVFSE